MANEFIIRKGYKSLSDSQITGSLSVSNAVTASFFTGSFRGDGSELTGIDGFPFTGSASISGSLTVVGPVTATEFIGNGSQLTGIDGFPFTGSAAISGSLTVDGNVIADSFTGSIQGTATTASYVNIANVDGFTAYSSSVNTAIGSVLDATTPITATINNTNSPFTITNQTIVIVDSTNGNVTVNLPDLDTVVGTPNQRPIIIYKNDYSQNVVYVQPNGSELVNGSSQDIIVSIQLAVIYNPTSAGWVTEGTSAQSLAELELFFVPRTETGSLSVATASYVEYADVVNKPTLVSGSSQISFSGITNKPTLVSGSSQITYSGLTGKPSGIVSSSVQVKEYNVFATTGSNGFNGNQAITGSLTVTGQVVAQTLNVQQVTSSIVYSSGSNIFGNELSNTQQFTGSMSVTGSLTVNGTNSLFNANNGTLSTDILTVKGGGGTGAFGFKVEANNGEDIFYTNNFTYDIIANPVSGKFGIGTATPASKLDINIGNLSTAGAFSNAALNLYNPTNIGAYSQITFGYTVGATYAASYLGFVSTNQGSFGYGDLVFGTRNVNTDTQATERLRITSGGNVGINTTSPSDFIDAGLGLAIISTTGRTGLSLGSNQTVADEVLGRLSFTNTNSTNIGSKRLAYVSGVRGNTDNSAYLEFGTANNGLGTQRMVISQTGNVGINTSSPTNSRLLIAGTHVSGNSILGVVPVGNNVATMGLYNSSGTRRGLFYSDTGFVRIESDADPIQIYAGGVNGINVTTGGNVGIGTANPGNFNALTFASPILDVVGSLNVRGIAANGASVINMGGETYRKAAIYTSIQDQGPYLGFAVGTSGTSSNTSDIMRLTSGGNVLIGTTSEDTGAKLRVSGNVRIDGFQRMTTYYAIAQPNTTATITISSPTGTNMQGSMQVMAGGYGNSLSGNVTGLWMVGGLLFFDNASTSTITQIVNSVTANGSMSFQRSSDQYTVTLANTSSLYTKTFYVSVIINGD